MKLSIVMPVYNEGEVIGKTIEGLERSVRTPHELLIVYDFDEDSTIIPAQIKKQKYKNIRLVKNIKGRGALNAIKTGFGKAKGRAICVMMADMTDDPRSIDRMVSKFDDGYDLVAASRYMSDGRQMGGPLLKKTFSRLAGLSLHLLAGIPVHDVTNSFRLYSAGFLKNIKIESDGGFELALELTAKAYIGGYKLAEVPTTWSYLSKTSRFQFRKWLPKYLKWYLWLLQKKLC